MNSSNNTKFQVNVQSSASISSVNPAVYVCFVLPMIVGYMILKKSKRDTERNVIRRSVQNVAVLN